MVNDKMLQWPGGRIDFSSGCVLMGVLNITPDSFSDGGEFSDVQKAVDHGISMATAGAAIIDIGPESTRPGSEAVSSEEQIKRAIPLIEQLSTKIDIPISIDTKNIDVAVAAIEAGASIINDITALADDRMTQLAAQRQVPVVLMHMQGRPKTMQKQPTYNDVVAEVIDFLVERAKKAEKLGIAKQMIFIDPGIGFGKRLEHNLELLKNIDKFVATGYRVCVGTSRKRFIGELTGKQVPAERIFGTAATVALCAKAGVSVVRIHDVEPMSDVLKVTSAIF